MGSWECCDIMDRVVRSGVPGVPPKQTLPLIFPCSVFSADTWPGAGTPSAFAKIQHLMLGINHWPSPVDLTRLRCYLGLLCLGGPHHLQGYGILLLGPPHRGTTPIISLTALSLRQYSFLSSANSVLSTIRARPPAFSQHHILPCILSFHFVPQCKVSYCFLWRLIISREIGSTTHQHGPVIPSADLELPLIVPSYLTIGGIWSQATSNQICSLCSMNTWNSWPWGQDPLAPEASGTMSLELAVLAGTVHSCLTNGGVWSQAKSNQLCSSTWAMLDTKYINTSLVHNILKYSWCLLNTLQS